MTGPNGTKRVVIIEATKEEYDDGMTADGKAVFTQSKIRKILNNKCFAGRLKKEEGSTERLKHPQTYWTLSISVEPVVAEDPGV